MNKLFELLNIKLIKLINMFQLLFVFIFNSLNLKQKSYDFFVNLVINTYNKGNMQSISLDQTIRR